MLRAISDLSGYAIDAIDGYIGTVDDFLFDDATWRLRWLVVDTGGWLPGRKVLIHPSTIGAIDNECQSIAVQLTSTRIKNSPSILHDQPVSRQMEAGLYGFYGWDANWGSNICGMGAIAAPCSSRPYFGGFGMGETAEIRSHHEDQDPHLLSAAEVEGYHIHASDGAIGHVQDLLVEEHGWGIRYLVVDARRWSARQDVLVSPYAVRKIMGSDRQMQLDITRGSAKASPAWTPPLDRMDQTYERHLHAHYGWPGYGW